MSDRLNLALIGAGQLGGSFVLALREAGADLHIAAYDADTAQTTLLQTRGGVDRIASSAADAVRGADVVMLAVPLRSYKTIAAEIAPHLGEQSIVTDLGSVKSSMQALGTLLPAARLVPGHPIAGGERAGAAVATADLFKGKLCILTPADETDANAVDTVETLWHIAGADVLRMPTPVHDGIYAYVSHLPHIIAFVAAELFYALGVRMQPEQEVLQKFLRISRSNPRMWADIALENREALLSALSTYVALLEHFISELRSGKEATTLLDQAQVATQFLPRIFASSLISSVSLYEQQSGMNLRPFGAGGMRDMVAPAAIDPEHELEAFSQAAPIIADVLEQAIPLFRQLESLIGSEDDAALLARITSMEMHAQSLATLRQ